MSTATFFLFTGDMATAHLAATLLAAVGLAGYAAVVLYRCYTRKMPKSDLAPALLGVVLTVGFVWLLVTAVMLVCAHLLVLTSSSLVPEDATGRSEQPLIPVPGTDTFVTSDGPKMFVAVEEGGVASLVEVPSVTYGGDAARLITETVCEPYSSSVIWLDGGFTCTDTITAALPR